MSNDLYDWLTKSANSACISSAHAEVISMSEGGRKIQYGRHVLDDAGFQQKTTVMYSDNRAALLIATRDYLTERTRHIHLRDLCIRELVENGTIAVKYVKSSENVADFLTKFQPVAVFRAQRDLIMGIVPTKRA